MDSLKQELHRTTSGNVRMHILLAVADGYFNEERFDSAQHYAMQCARLAQQAHNDTLCADAFDVAGVAANAVLQVDLAIIYIDSALFYAHKLPKGLRLVIVLRHKVEFLSMAFKNEGVIASCREALAICRELHLRSDEAEIYNSLAYYYGGLHNYSVQLDYINKCVFIHDSLGDIPMVANDYRQISICYSQQKKYRQSLQFALVSDSLYRQVGSNFDRNVLRMHTAVVYKNLGDYDQSIALHKRNLDSFRNNAFLQAVSYSNLGIAQSLKGQFEESRRSFLTALEINKKIKSPNLDVENYKELGRAFLRVKQYDSALHYAKKAERICIESKESINTYQECIAALSDIYAASGDMARAHDYDKKYEVLQDSIYQQILQSNLADAETRFNVVDKDKKLNVLSAENELQKVKAQRLVFALVLGVLVVVAVILAYRRTVRRNRILQQQKEMLAQQKALIDEQVVQLEAAASMKARFLSNISHELRTPATLLTGMLELMKKRASEQIPADSHQLTIAHDNSRRLQRMIEEILDLSRVEKKADNINIVVRELNPLLRRTIYAFEAVLQEKGLGLQYNDDGVAGISVAIDEDKFEKIINNLVYNAVKFNRPSGNIRVSVALSANRQNVIIEVADTGIGIPAQDLPFIFERFYQGAMSNKAKSEGVGIGLSLVKEFTAQMSGTISVASTAGEGTTFSLQLPVATAAMSSQPVGDDELPPIPWEKLERKATVLLVEDNDEMRYYLRQVLGSYLDIAEAANGRDALAWLAKNKPDLIISDMMMPEMDGRELVTAIKSSPELRKIPVITLTALADNPNQMSMLRLGVDDYMVKPFNSEELQVRVYNLLHNYAVRRQVAEEPREADDVVIDNDDQATEFRAKVTNYVLKNIKNANIAVADVAADLLLSERQFFRLAKSLTGFTPYQLIKEVRLQKAYELLLSGNMTKIEDVANRVGFETPWYFSRQFLERFGKRATDFL